MFCPHSTCFSALPLVIEVMGVMSNEVTDYRNLGPCVCVGRVWQLSCDVSFSLRGRNCLSIHCVYTHVCVMWHHSPHSCLSPVSVMERCANTHTLIDRPQRRQLWWIIFMSGLDKSVVMWADSAVCRCLQAVMQWFAYGPLCQPASGISLQISFYKVPKCISTGSPLTALSVRLELCLLSIICG